jgi:hypothetical protein
MAYELRKRTCKRKLKGKGEIGKKKTKTGKIIKNSRREHESRKIERRMIKVKQN